MKHHHPIPLTILPLTSPLHNLPGKALVFDKGGQKDLFQIGRYFEHINPIDTVTAFGIHHHCVSLISWTQTHRIIKAQPRSNSIQSDLVQAPKTYKKAVRHQFRDR
ncbi:hypothetical protein E4U13_002923 [Claviceps humidiphila]|uniref:Uncharacterized protein n=1 Tax=Claviceps humidiphila TaxID=1294629 RepID=A0A9P7Q191_9HYPO|nr:hypothetical protein E4U13_002923 [Claviceps humidiphila]